MRIFWEALIAFLAAAGLLWLCWLLFGRLLFPAGRQTSGFVVLPVRGDGGRMEYDLAGLRWLRGGGLGRFHVILADDGLDSTGRVVAAALAERDPRILICPMDRLPACVRAWDQSKTEELV